MRSLRLGLMVALVSGGLSPLVIAQVYAPGVEVQRTPDGGVTIRAPFVRVQTGPYGTRVRAPFTQIEEGRQPIPYQFVPEPYGPNPVPQEEQFADRQPQQAPVSYVVVEVPAEIKVALPEVIARQPAPAPPQLKASDQLEEPAPVIVPPPQSSPYTPKIDLGEAAPFPQEQTRNNSAPPAPGPEAPLESAPPTELAAPGPIIPGLQAPGVPEEPELTQIKPRKHTTEYAPEEPPQEGFPEEPPQEGFPSTLTLQINADDPLPQVKIDLYQPEPGAALVNPIASTGRTIKYGLKAMPLDQLPERIQPGAGMQVLAMIHPITGQTVCFPLRTPEGNANIQTNGPRARISYPSVIIDLQFQPDGLVAVEYSER